MNPPLSITVLCDDGKIGTLRQCQAIAEGLRLRLGASVSYHAVTVPWWMRVLTPWFMRFPPFKFLIPFFMARYVMPSLPDLDKTDVLVVAGRRSVLWGALLTKYYPFKTLVLLNPKCPYFDAVIMPRHDRGGYPQTFSLIGSLNPHMFQNRATEQGYKIAVMIGGNSKHYTYQTYDFVNLAHAIRTRYNDVQQKGEQVTLMISASRRTPQQGIMILKKALNNYAVVFYDPTEGGENPYVSFLESSHEIMVTADSVSMICEACYFGKPVIVFPLAIKNKRLQAFHRHIVEGQHGVFYDQSRDDYSRDNQSWPDRFVPLRETERIVDQVSTWVQQTMA